VSSLSPAQLLLPRSRAGDVVLGGAIVLVAVGVGLAAVQYPTAALLAAGLLALFAAAARFRAGTGAALLLVLAAVPIVTGFTIDAATDGAAASSSDAGVLKSLDDLVLIPGFVLLFVRGAMIPRQYRLAAVIALTALVASELAGFAASDAPLSLQLEAAWQDFRWLGAIGWGLVLIDWIPRRSRVTWAFGVLAGWNALNLLVVVFQIAGGGGATSRFSVPIVSGLFGHPTPGAIAATMLLVLVIADRASSPPRLSGTQIRTALLLALPALALSARIKPLLAVVAALLLILLVHRGRWYVQAAIVLAALPVGLTVAVVELQDVDTKGASPTTNPIASAVAHAPPRALLIAGAEQIAVRSFPFGGGLGTYGSGLNDTVEQRSFDSVGLGATDGFDTENPRYRADSLIARNLAERGMLGIGLWLVGMAALIVLALRLGGGHLFPAAAIVSALALAPVSPALKATNETFLYLLPASLTLLALPSPRDDEPEEARRE
jgi:hypothetical protein